MTNVQCPMTKKAVRFFVAGILVLLLSSRAGIAQTDCSFQTDIPESECHALLFFFSELGGPGWALKDGWLLDNFPCSWYGVTCTAGFVSELRLNDNQLSNFGPLDLWNFNLPHLRILHLHNNSIVSNIPSEFLDSIELSELRLDHNIFVSDIPLQIGNLKELVVLDLSWNQLSGAIPADIGSLKNLTHLNLNTNQLTGAIPTEIGDLQSLKSLDLGINQLSNAIPADIGDLDSLTYLNLSANQLTGALPATIGNLDSLVIFRGEENQLEGAIPPTIGDLMSLFSLTLQANLLTSIPAEIGDLSNLAQLYLNDNKLAGKIPHEIGRLSNLGYLFLNDNQLDDPLPSEIGDLSSLRTLSLHTNQISGSIPTTIGDLTNLEFLWLSDNELSGPIPSQVGDLPVLQQLDLSNNQLTRSIPPSIGSVLSLRRVRLNGNQLSGTIPEQLGDITYLWTLDLHANQLTGTVPYPVAELGAGIECNFSDNDQALCFPDRPPYTTIGVDPICQLPLSDALGLPIHISLLLEGAYGGSGTMSTALNPHLPLSQPFAGEPWTYSGSESVSIMPPNAVDWLLLELRTDTASTTATARQAVLLLDDGSVVETSGMGQPSFEFACMDSAFVVVHSRNHLPVMTSTKVDLTLWPIVVDLAATGGAYGTNPLKNVEGAFYALYAGDANADGYVQALDFNAYITQTLSGATGYQAADFNLDGQVQALDFNLYIANTLAGASSQVP